ncbi:MAG: ABC transporter ATP-binding protein, partial [Treponema sp.]|nr:ABC transporter ATP-binding protein [Treponema sp.]
VLIINEGRIAAQGTPEEIAGTMKGGDTWNLVLKNGPADLGRLAAGISGVTEEALPDGTRSLRFFAPTGTVSGEAIFDWAVAEGNKILGMRNMTLSLEDIFVSLTSEDGHRDSDGGIPEAAKEAGNGN